jgi:hypothetical protein
MKVREIGGTLHIVLEMFAEKYTIQMKICMAVVGLLLDFDPILIPFCMLPKRMHKCQQHVRMRDHKQARQLRRAKFQAKSRARKKTDPDLQTTLQMSLLARNGGAVAQHAPRDHARHRGSVTTHDTVDGATPMASQDDATQPVANDATCTPSRTELSTASASTDRPCSRHYQTEGCKKMKDTNQPETNPCFAQCPRAWYCERPC